MPSQTRQLLIYYTPPHIHDFDQVHFLRQILHQSPPEFFPPGSIVLIFPHFYIFLSCYLMPDTSARKSSPIQKAGITPSPSCLSYTGKQLFRTFAQAKLQFLFTNFRKHFLAFKNPDDFHPQAGLQSVPDFLFQAWIIAHWHLKIHLFSSFHRLPEKRK